LAINSSTAFLFSNKGVSLWNAPHPTRAETPQLGCGYAALCFVGRLGSCHEQSLVLMLLTNDHQMWDDRLLTAEPKRALLQATG